MSSRTIEIVGAGPAGLVAALTLKRAGFAVKVYEERNDVGMRFHGDFQGIENWCQEEDVLEQLQRMGIVVNFRCAPFYSATLFGDNRKRAEVHSIRPIFYLVRRGPVQDSLDQGLKAQALACGVEILFGRRVEKIGSRVINATGPKAVDMVAKGVTFDTDLQDQLLAILDDRLAPGGYAYLLVHQGRATMATILFREYRCIRECFEQMERAFRALVSFKMENPREFGGFGNFFLRSAELSNHLSVGEAAGFQDLLWGFGIRYAITSGYLAAQSIIAKKDYGPLWQEAFLPWLRASLVNRTLVDCLGHGAYRYLVSRLARGEDVRLFIRRLYGWNQWKRLLLPLATRHYQSKVSDERFRLSEVCNCVWCRCQRD